MTTPYRPTYSPTRGPSPVPFRRSEQATRNSRHVRRLKADRPEDLLAVLPYLLGFRPEESLVMMVVAYRIVKVTVRVDLSEEAGGVARRFGAIAVAHRATGVVLVAYSSDPGRADAMLGPVMAGLGRFGVIEALYTDGRRWWSRTCSAACCPADGTPYEIESNRLAAEAVFHGMSSFADRSDVERLCAGPPEADHQVLRNLADDLLSDVLRPERSQRRLRMRELVTDYVTRRERGDQVLLSDRELVTLALLAVDLRVRDEAWVAMNRADAWIHVELWQQVVAHAIPDLAPPALCLLGVASWIDGQGTLQVCCSERARRLDPTYSMAGVLDDINLNAVPPDAWDELKLSLREAVDAAYDRPPEPDPPGLGD
ncbi:MAG: DUF4192 domain-containing protein [Microlunatus sp.]|nr:DUF4192 domain-containing protein [Microlunatus sp.]